MFWKRRKDSNYHKAVVETTEAGGRRKERRRNTGRDGVRPIYGALEIPRGIAQRLSIIKSGERSGFTAV